MPLIFSTVSIYCKLEIENILIKNYFLDLINQFARKKFNYTKLSDQIYCWKLIVVLFLFIFNIKKNTRKIRLLFCGNKSGLIKYLDIYNDRN